MSSYVTVIRVRLISECHRKSPIGTVWRCRVLVKQIGIGPETLEIE